MKPHLTLITLIAFAGLQTSADAATFIVTNTNDSGAGSLRQAINDANIAAGTDFINFNIPGAGVHTIFPLTPLPFIIGTTSVDGASQPGFTGTPLIEIAGDSAGAGAVGLQIFNNSSQIGWLTINGFSSHGIRISGSGNATIVGCWIGINNSGTDNPVYPNGGNGIFIDDSPNNDIGGTLASFRNIISGNSGSGVLISGAASSGNIVKGNYIGITTDGNGDLGNTFAGIRVTGCNGNVIGGTAAGSRNVIAGSTPICIDIANCPSSPANNRIFGNYIGLNASGNAVLGFNLNGIKIFNSVSTIVGGATASARNVIAGSNNVNIEIGTNSFASWIQGNYIGTDYTGSVALSPTSFAGVRILDDCNVLIGGPNPGDGNVISGNAGDGILISGSSSGSCPIAPHLIFGNFIGVAADGSSPLGNGGSGVHISRRTDNRIGNSSGGSNVIAHNGEAGIFIDNSSVSGIPSRGNFISANSIHSNAELGIDLSASPILDTDGVTPNDLGDPDLGANNFQNYPVLTSAGGDSISSLNVVGTLDSLPLTSYRIEVFGNNTCDPSGFGEGTFYLGFFDVITSAGGISNFNVIVTTVLSFGPNWLLTATATNNSTRDTSEFSSCIPIDSTFCGPGAGSCYAALGNATPGCDNGDCCNVICDVDPFCCTSDWDPLCASQALEICGNSGNELSGDCFTPNPTNGCYDLTCAAIVCEVDPYCCDTEWDATCASEALAMCAAPCPGDISLVTPGVVNVTDLLFLLASWGQTGPPRPRADLAPPPTGDGNVNVTDLLALLAGWGPCP